MKKFIALVMLAAGSTLFAAQKAESGLLMHSDFDSYDINAKFAKGDKRGFGLADKDLQLRMYPGPNKGNALALGRHERINYNAPGNVLGSKGTISIWVSPINWNFGGDEIYGLINVSSPNGQAIRIFKHSWGPYIIGQYQWKPDPKGKIYSRQVQMMIDPKEWDKGMWHHIAITWDQDNLKLYLDGIHPAQPKKGGVPRYWKNKPAPPDYPVSNNKFPGKLPNVANKSKIYVGDVFNNKNVPNTIRTAFDEIKIYDRPLSPNEMRKEYERVMPSAARQDKVPAHFVAVPKGAKSSVVYLHYPMSKPNRKINASAALRHDGKFFYIDYHADFPAKVRSKTARDAFLWEDDSFEVHLVSPQNNRIQFIVNANGAIFDKKDGSAAWNAPGVTASAKTDDKSFSASLKIPLAVLGKTDGLWKADFTVAQHVGTKTNYYRWSNIVFDNSFTATSELVFGKTADFVAPVFNKPIESGVIDMNVTSTKYTNVDASYTSVGRATMKYPGNMRSWQISLPAGKVRFNIEAQAGKRELYRYFKESYIDYPMELSFNTIDRDRRIDVLVDFSNAGGDFLNKLKSGIPVTLELKDNAGKVLASASANVKEVKSTVKIGLPPVLAKGNYSICAKADTLSHSIAYRMPDETPYKLKLAKDNSVPYPWHPVKSLGNNRYSVLDRIFEFDGTSPLPRKMLVKGENVLAKQPEFTIDGKAVAWQNFKVKSVQPDVITFTAQGKVGKAVLDFTGQLHFDGMYLMQLALNAPAVNNFGFNTAVPAQFAKFVLDPYLLPWHNNSVKVDVRALHANEKRPAGLLWLTGHEKGLCFWNKTNANWLNVKNRASLEVNRDSKVVKLTARIIDKPVKLPATATYTLVLQPTPPRRPGKGGHDINFCSYGRVSECNFDFPQAGSNFARPGDGSSPMTGVIPKYPDKYEAQYPKSKARLCTYTLPGHLNEMEPDFDFWDKNNRNLPGTTHSGTKFGQTWTVWQYCNNASEAPADLWTYWGDFTAKRHPKKFGGLYFDVATVRNCENAAHGCGGTDIFGQPFFSSDALGLRNFLLRVYKTMKKHNCIVILHCHVAYVPFTHDFIDSFAPGENTYTAAVRNLWYTYTEEIPLEIYQSELNWRKAGVPYAMIFQQGRATDLMPALKKYGREILDNPEYALRSITAMAVHELNYWCHYLNRPTLNRFWKLRRFIQVDDAKDYHGYWVSNAVKSASPKVYCGWYEWDKGVAPFRRVLIISNFNRNAVPLKLKLDWKALGIAPVKEFTDVWENKTVTMDDLAKYQIPGAHFLILGIK